MKTRTLWLVLGLCCVSLAALPSLFAGTQPYNASPMYPEDIEINRAYKDDMQFFGGDENNRDGIVEPMFSKLMGRKLKMPHTKQIIDGQQANLLQNEPQEAFGAISVTGHEIHSLRSPQRDLFSATVRLNNSARRGVLDTDAAEDLLDILLGRTQGMIYDGFGLLNFNRFTNSKIPTEAYAPELIAGEYKMKQIRYTGEQEPSWKEDGTLVNIWEVDVNYLWYDQQFDSDTFLIKIPFIDEASGIAPQPDDTLRVNYTIYSLVEEDFAPTQVTVDAQVAIEFPDRGSVRFPYKGEDAVWVRVNPQTVHRISVQHTALRFFRGIYTWGWNVHPPRIQFLQFINEIQNANTGNIELDPEGMSYATRNRELTIDGIGEAAPEKKLYRIAQQVLDGVLTAEDLVAHLNNPAVGPKGTWMEWMSTMADQRTLPPEVRTRLVSEGMSLNDYDFVTVYMNNELYGAGPLAHTIRSWSQGDVMRVRLINLDAHTHYFRNVDFGPTLHNDLADNVDDGVFSFEIMNFKPVYGAPKIAEMQWRAGFGFRPHYAVIQHDDVFPRKSDRRRLQPYLAPNLDTGKMEVYWGYQFSEEARRGDFPFNPPNFIVATEEEPAFDKLYDLDIFPWRDSDGFFLKIAAYYWERWRYIFPGSFREGIVIGQLTEGFGEAKLCPGAPLDFCPEDLSPHHWRGIKNWPVPDDPLVPKTELRFPPFLRNPNPDAGGDIIPPTWTWRPFLWINPHNGTLYNDPDDTSQGYWADKTYAHGRPIFASEDVVLTIEMPRSAGQVFYQFDDLFHDNAIFSPHPID